MERSLKKKRTDSSEPDLPELLKMSENGEASTDKYPLPDPEVNIDSSIKSGELNESSSYANQQSSLPHTGPAMIAVANLHKGYVKAKKLIPVLRGIDMEVAQGEYLSIVGQSGSGKSTLLHLMGTLDVPDKGTIHFDGQRIDNLPSVKRDYLRNHYIGMIFQFYHLIPEMTTLENVLAPLMIRDNIFQYLA
ncbi:MAG: ATP-binding cassette domain-containing protein, partial [Planctomycetia bacterium]|nr:ATP-binding cassette domain-containing protein [Planctomycetia bacterium]